MAAALLRLVFRTLAVILIVLIIHALVGCAGTPRRAIRVPSVVPVLREISTARAEVAQSRVLVGDVRLSLTKTLRPEQAAAGAALDAMLVQLNARLQNAEAHLATGTEAAAALQPQIETLGDHLNRNADLAAVANAKAQARGKRLWLYAGLIAALVAWIFRKPLVRAGLAAFKLARLAVGFPI